MWLNPGSKQFRCPELWPKSFALIQSSCDRAWIYCCCPGSQISCTHSNGVTVSEWICLLTAKHWSTCTYSYLINSDLVAGSQWMGSTQWVWVRNGKMEKEWRPWLFFLSWVRALKKSHIQGHVSLTTMTTRMEDNILYFKTLLYFTHIQKCVSHFLMSSMHYTLPLNPPTPQPHQIIHPIPPTVCKLDPFIHSKEWHRHSVAAKEHPRCKLIGTRVWKWGFLCYCLTKWPCSLQGSFCLIYPTPCHLRHKHTHFCYTNTQRKTSHISLFFRQHTFTNANSFLNGAVVEV